MSASQSYLLYHGLWQLLDWLFPPVCGGCGKTYTRWCNECQESVHLITPPVCERCGHPVESEGICTSCQQNSPSFSALRSWAIYEGALREALQRMKYQRDIGLGEVFAQPLIELISDNHWYIDIVVPVPLSIARYKERGYNQSSLIALPIALHYGFPYRPNALKRIRETASQVGLNLIERRKNVDRAFVASPKIVKGRSVLLIDDIATSGSTMESCANALRESGAREVFGLTVARAVLSNVLQPMR